MKETLQAGLTHTMTYKVPVEKTVPYLYPESPLLASMPEVFATGFMVGLFEWCCAELMAPHLDEGEGSLGVHVDFSHQAATPPGMTITVTATVVLVDRKRVELEVEGHDGVDVIGGGRHQRMVVRWDAFEERVAQKAAGV